MSIYEFFKYLKCDHLSFLYKGRFSDSITDKIISLSENNISSNKEELASLKKKVPFLMVESFQNIIRHGDKFKNETGFFMTRSCGLNYYIVSGNGIDNIDLPTLRAKLEKVNSFNKEELKDYYLEIINHKDMSNKGGAGLGLIEMARKSGQKLDFGFFPVNEEYSIFYLQINLRSNDAPDSDIADDSVSVDFATNFHQKMRDNNILMVYQGDFSLDAIFPVLTMIEDNLKHEVSKISKSKSIYHVLVELLQNISKHANMITSLKKGIFTIAETQNSYLITAGNYIHIEKMDFLNQQLTYLNSLSKEELKLLYRKVLGDGNENESEGAGLGLIDLARESSAPIDYKFHHEENNLTFFELTIKIG